MPQFLSFYSAISTTLPHNLHHFTPQSLRLCVAISIFLFDTNWASGEIIGKDREAMRYEWCVWWRHVGECNAPTSGEMRAGNKSQMGFAFPHLQCHESMQYAHVGVDMNGKVFLFFSKIIYFYAIK